MTLAALLTDQVTIVRAGTVVDRYHNVTPDWTNATRVTVSGSFQPAGTTENVSGRDTVVTADTLYLAYGTDLLATDRVEYGGATFEVDGAPLPNPGPRKLFLTVRLRALVSG